MFEAFKNILRSVCLLSCMLGFTVSPVHLKYSVQFIRKFNRNNCEEVLTRPSLLTEELKTFNEAHMVRASLRACAVLSVPGSSPVPTVTF